MALAEEEEFTRSQGRVNPRHEVQSFGFQHPQGSCQPVQSADAIGSTSDTWRREGRIPTPGVCISFCRPAGKDSEAAVDPHPPEGSTPVTVLAREHGLEEHHLATLSRYQALVAFQLRKTSRILSPSAAVVQQTRASGGRITPSFCHLHQVECHTNVG